MEPGSVAGSVSLRRFLSARSTRVANTHRHTRVRLCDTFRRTFSTCFRFSFFVQPKRLCEVTFTTRSESDLHSYLPSLQHLMIKLGLHTRSHRAEGQTGDRMSRPLCICTKAGGLRCCVGVSVCTSQQKHTEAIREHRGNASNHHHTVQFPK